MTYSPAIQKLIEVFSRFPEVGARTASRFVFYLLKQGEIQIDEVMAALLNLKKSVRLCGFCHNHFEPKYNPFDPKGKEGLCQICFDSRRDKTLLCVVEKEADLVLIEKTKKYPGLYFILGGLFSSLRKKESEKLLADNLLKRIKNPASFGLAGAKFSEIILALSLTTEAEATSLYLERVLKPLGLKISRLGRGLPLGAEIEYADEETLSSALEGRREL